MSSFNGVGDYQTSGQVGVAVIGTGVTLAINNFSTSADTANLQAVLTIRGNLEKRPIALGSVTPEGGSFQVVLPDGTDISLFNTLVLRDGAADVTIGQVTIA